jgi:hypothetical protein
MGRLGLSVCIVAALVCAAVAAAPGPDSSVGTMYARSSVVVRDGRTFSAKTLVRLRQGDAVKVTGQEGRYYRVVVDAGTGYVYQNKLTDEKPEDVAALLAAGPGAQRIELSELEAGGALRGLSPLAEDYARNAQVPEWAVQAVEGMGSRVIKPEELEMFQKEGRLGEYGEGVQ